MVPKPTPISLLENSVDLQNADSVFRSAWNSNPEVDLKVIGQHLPIGKRNSTPVRFGSVMPFKTNPLPPPPPPHQQQLPYPGPIPGPLVGTHFANANPQMMNHLPEAVPQHRRLDRSLSEPARNVSLTVTTQQTTQQFQQQLQLPPPGQVQPPQSGSSRYKTELCRPFAETGFCKYGEKCQFAHGGVDLRSMSRHPKYKTELCRTFHTTGLCGYGTRCHFIHNADERRSPDSGTPDSGTHSPVSQLSNSPPQMQHNSAAIQQRMMYLDKTLKRELQMGPSPPSSFDGSPTESAGSFFDETFPIMPEFFAQNDSIDLFNTSLAHSPPARDYNNQKVHQIHQSSNTKEDLPPLIGMDTPPESLVGDMDNLSISPDSQSPPPYSTLNLSIGGYNTMQQQQHSPPMASDRMQSSSSFNPNLLLDQFDCARYLRLPIFETLTEV